MNSLFLNISCACLAVLSSSLLKHSLGGQLRWNGSLLAFAADLLGLMRQPLLWVGVAAFIAANALWLLVLATQRLSVAYPMQLAMVFVLTTLVAALVFSERIAPLGFAGLALILAGVVLVVQS